MDRTGENRSEHIKIDINKMQELNDYHLKNACGVKLYKVKNNNNMSCRIW